MKGPLVLLLNIFILYIGSSCALDIKHMLKEFKVSYNDPVIGIMTLPNDETEKYPSYYTRIQAPYVKYLESAGAKVIPVEYTSSFEEVEELMQHINGIFFTGGALDLIDNQTGIFDTYGNISNHIYQTAIEMNEQGNYFPLWGTCMGHQLLMLLESKQKDIIKFSNLYGKSIGLDFHFLDQSQTRLYSEFSDDLILKLSTQHLTYNVHHYGILYEDYLSNENLLANFTVLSTNVADDETEFLSSMEHKRYPFYSVQYHPEQNLFKYTGKTNIPHTEPADDLAILLAKKFVDEARKSTNRFDTYEDLVDKLIETVSIYDIAPESLGEQYFIPHDSP